MSLDLLPAPGLHYGVAFEDYQRWPAENFSKIKNIRRTASKCKYAIDNPKAPTKAMALGSALHVATLEPARFDGMFYICPPCDRRTTEGKEEYAKHEQAAGSKLIIREGSKEDESLLSEVGRIRGMAASIRKSKAASLFLDCPGQNEVSMLWKDAETGLTCKGRMDRFVPEFNIWDGAPVIVEIKSTCDANEWAFAKDVDSMGYAAQAANYMTGHRSITGKRAAHIFIAVESEPPHDLKVYILDDQSIQTGMLQYRTWLNRFAECVKSGIWPGYDDKMENLSLPKYSQL